MREPVGSRGLGSLAAGDGQRVAWQAVEVGWGGRQWLLSDGMEPWSSLHCAPRSGPPKSKPTSMWANFQTLYFGVVIS